MKRLEIGRKQSRKILKLFFKCLCVSSTQMSVHQLHAWCLKRPERTSDPLGLASWIFVSRHAGAENQARVSLNDQAVLLEMG